MWKVVVVLLALSDTILGASIFHCPNGAICHENGAIESSSFKFMAKLGPKQSRTILSLTVSNASLDKVPPEIKYLKNLEYLDLSFNSIQMSSISFLPNLKILKLNNNNLKNINLATLPKSIEDLDLSNNLLSNIPKDWNSLRSLKTLHLFKNPIDCDCALYNVLTYNKMIKDGINIPEPVTCHLHKTEKSINLMNCTMGDIMLYDEAIEGSGNGEDIFSEVSERKTTVPHYREQDDVEENELIDDKDDLPPEEKNLAIVQDVVTSEATAEEGSGDFEGSGFALVEIPHIPACHVNCSTPEPIGSNDEKGASPLPHPTDQFKIIAEDVFNPLIMNPEPTSSIATTTTTTSTSSVPVEVTEEPIIKEQEPILFNAPGKEGDVDVFSNVTKTGEMEKATALSQNNYAVYAVVIVGIVLAFVFLVYLIKKRKGKKANKNRREIPSGLGEEMKPLGKPAIHPVNEKNGKAPNNIPEHIPLINGQNGKPKDEPVLTSFVPLEHPEFHPETDLDEPELREKAELLTPPRERVTIRASEIPDSILKTPVLVHRQKNSEGEIVTTVLPP